MSRLRKLELISGAMTLIIAVILSVMLVEIDRNASQHLGKVFVLWTELKIALAIYLGPALLIALGSYIHAVKRNDWGWISAIFGALLFIAIFFALLVVLVWSGSILLPALQLLLTLCAITTAVIASVIQRQTDADRVRG